MSEIHNQRKDISAKVLLSQFSTVHADKVLVAIDRSIDVVTLTLLNMHPLPQIGSEGWTISDINYDIVGEIKLPLSVMYTMATYFIQEISNGLNIIPLIEEHRKQHPNPTLEGISYGPTKFQISTIKKEENNEQ